MTKTGRCDKNIDFGRNWQNLGFVAKFLMKFALFDEMAFLAAKYGEDLEKALSLKFGHVTF